MQTLASCEPIEFLKQTNKIRKAVEHWLDLTDIANIYRRKPELITLRESMTQDERQEAFDENTKRAREQSKKNMMDIFDSIMDKHPEETLEILALCCFVEPSQVNDHTVAEYLVCLTELMNDQAVLGFFTSLMLLMNTNIQK